MLYGSTATIGWLTAAHWSGYTSSSPSIKLDSFKIPPETVFSLCTRECLRGLVIWVFKEQFYFLLLKLGKNLTLIFQQLEDWLRKNLTQGLLPSLTEGVSDLEEGKDEIMVENTEDMQYVMSDKFKGELKNYTVDFFQQITSKLMSYYNLFECFMEVITNIQDLWKLYRQSFGTKNK